MFQSDQKSSEEHIPFLFYDKHSIHGGEDMKVSDIDFLETNKKFLNMAKKNKQLNRAVMKNAISTIGKIRKLAISMEQGEEQIHDKHKDIEAVTNKMANPNYLVGKVVNKMKFVVKYMIDSYFMQSIDRMATFCKEDAVVLEEIKSHIR
jgi:hypothetical protein